MSSTLIPLSWAIGAICALFAVIIVMVLAIFEISAQIDAQAEEINRLKRQRDDVSDELSHTRARAAALWANQN